MAASWKELLTLIVTIFLIITISSSQDAINTEKRVVAVDETELDDDDVGTDAGVHSPIEDTGAPAAVQEPGDRQVTREPEVADETEIGTEPDETEIGDPVSQLDYRRQKLEETLVDIRKSFLRRRSRADPRPAGEDAESQSSLDPDHNRSTLDPDPDRRTPDPDPDRSTLNPDRSTLDPDPNRSTFPDHATLTAVENPTVQERGNEFKKAFDSVLSVDEPLEEARSELNIPAEPLLLKESIEEAIKMKIPDEPLLLKEPMKEKRKTRINAEPVLLKEPSEEARKMKIPDEPLLLKEPMEKAGKTKIDADPVILTKSIGEATKTTVAAESLLFEESKKEAIEAKVPIELFSTKEPMEEMIKSDLKNDLPVDGRRVDDEVTDEEETEEGFDDDEDAEDGDSAAATDVSDDASDAPLYFELYEDEDGDIENDDGDDLGTDVTYYEEPEADNVVEPETENVVPITDNVIEPETDNVMEPETDIGAVKLKTDSALKSETDIAIKSETDNAIQSETDNAVKSEADNTIKSEADSAVHLTEALSKVEIFSLKGLGGYSKAGIEKGGSHTLLTDNGFDFPGSKVEETVGKSDNVPSETLSADMTEAAEGGTGSESHPLETARADDAFRGVPSEPVVQVTVDAPQHEHMAPVQLDSAGLGEERHLAAEEVGAGKAVSEVDPTEADDDETDVIGAGLSGVDQSVGGTIDSGSVGQESIPVEAIKVGKQPEGHKEIVQDRTEVEGVRVEAPLADGRVEGARDGDQRYGEPPVPIEQREQVVGGVPVGVQMENLQRLDGTQPKETVPTERMENVVTGIPVEVNMDGQQRHDENQPRETVPIEQKENVEGVIPVGVHIEEQQRPREALRMETVPIEPKENVVVEEPVGIHMEEQQRYNEDQRMEMEHLPTSSGSPPKDANRKVGSTEMSVEKAAEAVGTADAKRREDDKGAEPDADVVHGAVDSGTLSVSAADRAVPRDESKEESKRVGDDGTEGQAAPPEHDAANATGDGSPPEDERVGQQSQPPQDLEKDAQEDAKSKYTQVDMDLKFPDRLLAQDGHESDIPLHRERSGSLHHSGGGPALRSLLSEKVPAEELLSKGDRPSWEQGESSEHRVPDDINQERTQSPLYEEGKEQLGEDRSPEEFPTDDDNSSVVSRFLTLRPYVILSERAFSFLDPWLDEIVRSFPPELQTFFVKAPFALTPPRALLLFIASCISLLVVSSCAWRQSCTQKSRRFEKQSILEQLSTVQGALLISEHEKEAVIKELESLREQVHSYEDRSTLSSGEAGQLSSQVQSLTLERGALQQKVAQQLDQISDLSTTVSSQLQSISTATEKSRSLQKKLDDTTAHAGMLESQLYELQTTLQQSQSSALEMQSQLQSMTEEISILQTSKDQLLLEAEGWSEKVQEQADQISKLRDQEKTHQEAIGLRDKEINVLRECYQQLKLFESCLDSSGMTSEEGDCKDEDDEENRKQVRDEVQKKIKSMIDVAQVNAKLNATEEEKNSLKHALSMEMESRMELEDQVKLMKAEMEKVMERRQEAEQQATRTALKMDVLVNYFKEKETDLNRKLGEQEARERASVDQLVNTDERTKEFENMVHLYKEQVEDLQKEIQSIEADYRKQIALQEKKAHENWLVARQSEREVKEYKIESQMLRHKILELQNKLEAATAEMKTGQEMAQAAPGLGLANGIPPGDDRPTSRPLLQPPFGPPPFIPGPFPPLDRSLPPPLFGPPMPPHPSMLFDRRAQDMRSPPPFDMWPPPSHMRRSPMPPRDRSPPRNRSPSPPSQRGRMSPTSLRGGRYSPPRGVRSPPSVIGDRHSPRFAGPRGGPHPGGNPRPPRPPHNRPGIDQRPGPRLPPHLQRSDFHVPSSGQRSSTPDC